MLKLSRFYTYFSRLDSTLRGKGWKEVFNFIPVSSDGSAPKLDKPFQQSTWVMRAIRYCADSIASVPLRFNLDRPGGEQPLKDATLEAFWKRPAHGR